MTNKQRLETLLRGGIPDIPPHFELLFQIEKDYFGMDAQPIRDRYAASKVECDAAMEAFYLDVRWRLIEECGWAAIPSFTYDIGYYNMPRLTRLKDAVGAHALVYDWNGGGVFSMPSGADIMDFVVMLFEQPEEMHLEARRRCEEAKVLATQQVEAGVDFIFMNSDFGFNDAPFVSPAHFREFVTPYMTEIVQHIHDLGVPVILHSDGNLTSILDQLHGTGIDGYQSVDPQGHMDIRRVREDYPDWLLMGNVPCNMLQDAVDADIRQAVDYCMTHGGIGKRYIFSTSNCIFAGMPPERYRIMLDEYRILTGDKETAAAIPES